MNDLGICILAAGNGTRMYAGKKPKVLHHLGAYSLLEHVIKTAQLLSAKKIVTVINPKHRGKITKAITDPELIWAAQDKVNGTGSAVNTALPYLSDCEQILVLYADVPLVSASILKSLLSKSSEKLGLITCFLDNPHGYGRVFRNKQGHLQKIIEHKDCSKKQLEINEIFTGILCAPYCFLQQVLPNLSNNNMQQEYYLTDAISLWAQLFSDDSIHTAINPEPIHTQGVNTKNELAQLERYYQAQQAEKFMSSGVQIMDPARFDCRGSINIAATTTIDINVILSGNTSIGKHCYIGANSVLHNCQIGDHVNIKPFSHLTDTVVEKKAEVGPFCYTRSKTYLEEGSCLGSFVEAKKTRLGKSSKAKHLTYLGDATIEANVNIGAGVITANYDGKNKHQTQIKQGAFIGVDTQLIAPITIGSNAYIGAGSTISKDAPNNKLSLSRSKQVTIDNWQPKHHPSKLEKQDA